MPNDFMEDSSVSYPDDYNPSLNGIAGWLVVVVLGLVLTIILSIAYIVKLASYWGLNSLADTLIAIIIPYYAVVCILGSGAILYCMFTRRILFRTLYVIQAVVSLILLIVIASIAGSSGADASGDILKSLVSSVIWITYLYKSSRVRNTFIYPYEYPEEQYNY